jgi:hypothetical protein
MERGEEDEYEYNYFGLELGQAEWEVDGRKGQKELDVLYSADT